MVSLSSPRVADQISGDGGGGTTAISAVPTDVLLSHILSRLDGPTLASVSCASSQLHSLSADQDLWSNVCRDTWHSTLDPRVQHIISTFPNTHRSFFSDSFPLLSAYPTPTITSPQHPLSSPICEIISAVDIHYKNKLIFSKVQETNTQTSWFSSSPFGIDLLDPKDLIETKIPHHENIPQDLEENLTLSWIMVDPIRRRAANLSSWRPVSVQRHWLSEEIQVKFVTILGGNSKETATDFIQCGILVAFGGCEDGINMQVKEVSLQVEDKYGISLSGKDSLEILQLAIENGKRKKGSWKEKKEMYDEYLRMKREREEENMKRERKVDSMCMAFWISIFTLFVGFALYC